MKKERLFTFVLLLYFNFLFSQKYSVSNFQKINELKGKFNGVLDIDDVFGISIDNIGDLDGNGVNDLVVGASGDDDGGTNRGAVWVLFLNSSKEVISYTKISSTSGNFKGVLDNNDRFGGAVSYLGDINNDGLVELAVGADYDGDGGHWHGAVWILSLNSNGTVKSHAKISDTQGGFTGFINGDAIFGTDIENIGDLDGDGIEDIAVGARRDGDGGLRRGAVWILFMNANLTVKNHQKISDTQGGFSGALQFEDFFGGSVVNIGDLDKDGVNDIIVGAYRDDDLNVNSGSFYVLFLNKDGTVKKNTKVSNLTGGLTKTIANNALFGESIDGVIDIDNDGKIEVIVGALREYNPTLGNQTGAFYLIELNNDGTVSEDFLYTFGENCFSGSLNNGDFFGGSVTILNNENGVVSFAIGAYKDSENGGSKGAIWLIDLGDKITYKSSYTNPSLCGLEDGTIKISDLLSNTNYTISYVLNKVTNTFQKQSNSKGEIEIQNLPSGKYEKIKILQTGTSCIGTLDSIEIIESTFILEFDKINPTSCALDDGKIKISKLTPNKTYVVDYFKNSVHIQKKYTSNSVGEITISSLEAGKYENIMVVGVDIPCSDGIGFLELEIPELKPKVEKFDSNFCDSNDGKIIISELNANKNYSISYEINNSVFSFLKESSSTGKIEIENLTPSILSNIKIIEIDKKCQTSLNDIEIKKGEFNIEFKAINPTSCNTKDGIIQISKLRPNVLYNIAYTIDGVLVKSSFISTNTGEIVLTSLKQGEYKNIKVESSIGSCSMIKALIQLSTTNFSHNEYIVKASSSCTKNDGSIIITNLNNNRIFEVSFEFEGVVKKVTLKSDNQGKILLPNLKAGNYKNISFLEVLTGCLFNISELEIKCLPEENKCFKVKKFFTPNNDGHNDTWSLDMLDSCSYIVHIYNRFGKKIAKLTPLSSSWDGTFNGKVLPPNDYWFLIEYINNLGEKKYYKSNFSLIIK